MPSTLVALPPSPAPVARKARIMARAKFLRLIRQMTFSREQFGILTRFHCEHCQEPVAIQRGDARLVHAIPDAAAINPKRDAFSLTCSCTVWTVRG